MYPDDRVKTLSDYFIATVILCIILLLAHFLL